MAKGKPQTREEDERHLLMLERLGTAIVCPEQLSSMNGATDERHCGSCAVCWSCDAPIVFVEH